MAKDVIVYIWAAFDLIKSIEREHLKRDIYMEILIFEAIPIQPQIHSPQKIMFNLANILLYSVHVQMRNNESHHYV